MLDSRSEVLLVWLMKEEVDVVELEVVLLEVLLVNVVLVEVDELVESSL